MSRRSFGALPLGPLCEVDLILEDDQVATPASLSPHRPGIRTFEVVTCLIRGDEEKGGVHNCRAVHCRNHEDVVCGPIFVPAPIDEREVAYALHTVPTSWPLARWLFLVESDRNGSSPPWASVVFAFVDLLDIKLSVQMPETDAQKDRKTRPTMILDADSS